jgi:hypothetical protein
LLRLICEDIFGDRDVFSISKWAGLFSRQLVGANTFMTKRDVDDLDKEEIKILFSRGHEEMLALTEDADDESPFSSLRQLLVDWGYVIGSTKAFTFNQLADARILVIGAPWRDFGPEELDAIEQFVRAGGGLLLASNAETMFDPPLNLNQRMAEMASLQFQEYLNYPITYLQVFQPHYVTANVRRVKVGKVASLAVSDGARHLALTKATQQPIMACANVENGRVVAIGDVGWLTNDLPAVEDNEQLAVNMFHWLATRNTIDIEKIVIPETVKWGQTTKVVLQLRNSNNEMRPQIECVLESDADAIISKPTRKKRSLPPGKTTRMQWSVCPQILGDQELRLSVYIDGHESLFFDQLLPKMSCLAPGYFTLKIGEKIGGEVEKLKTDFQTGDHFTVEGAFHWAVESEQLSYQLKLDFGDGLIERGREAGSNVTRWHLQALTPGSHELELSLAESGQSLPALVTVISSYQNRLAEIQAAYVYPLEAEIAERLRQVDERLISAQVQAQPFKILPPEEFVQAVYRKETVSWLQGVLAAARREQWYNPDLLELVLTYIAPTYLPDHGSFIPYDPGLASHLARLHPANSKSLEYNLLCSEESEGINTKQNVAAYLLHEKFGHGFFYTQTRLGQQLAILQRHGFLDESDQRAESKKVAKIMEDSAIIVNEGFAAWMELTFLGKLDREVRQAVYPRWMSLTQQAGGLDRRKRGSQFFRTFPPRFDSRYREGFEYLEFIGQRFDPRCAVRAFLIATHIDFGIVEDVHGKLHFRLEPAAIKQSLLKPEKPDWRSHFRLRSIADLLYQYDEEVEALLQEHHCPTDCHKSDCPLETFIAKRLEWRKR